MTLFSISVASLMAAALLAAGVINAVGSAKISEDFVRWGYPGWWNRVTGGLEMLAAALVALPATRVAGLVFGGAICIAAVATVVRCRDYGHIAPGLLLTALTGLDLALILN